MINPDDIVRVNEFFLEVKEVDGNTVKGIVNLGDGLTGWFVVPLMACEKFDANRDMVEGDFDERD